MGEVPDWYPVLAAARYMQVPVWDLMEAPYVWVHRAHAAQYAENHAQEMKSKQTK